MTSDDIVIPELARPGALVEVKVIAVERRRVASLTAAK
jgi:hypothetical protein